MGLNLSVNRLGSVLCAAVVPAIYDKSGLGAALSIGFLVCCFSLVCGIGMTVLDKKTDDEDR